MWVHTICTTSSKNVLDSSIYNGDKYKLLAKTQPIATAYIGAYFSYNHASSWISLGCTGDKFVISWDIPYFTNYDWIALYKSTSAKDSDYEKYFWVDKSKSTKKTETEVFDIKMYSDNYGEKLISPHEYTLHVAEYTLHVAEYSAAMEVIKRVDDETKKRFESLYEIWQYSINGFGFMVCSDMAEYKNAEGYEELLAMGAEIIPLVIEKLLDEANFMALVLYDDLQQSNELNTQYTQKDDLAFLLEGEQTRAKRTVKKWVNSI